MGCPRLTYREKEERLNFLGLWKKSDGSKNGEDYYPFGLSFNSYTRENTVPQNYLFNGKELQTDLGLNWEDFGARMYMPDIGRWGVIDPLSERSRRWSPYVFAFDNPIRFIDPDGMEGEDPNDKKKKMLETVKKSAEQSQGKNPDINPKTGKADLPSKSYGGVGGDKKPGESMDCASLVRSAYKAATGKDLFTISDPKKAKEIAEKNNQMVDYGNGQKGPTGVSIIAAAGKEIPLSQVKEGDVLIFGNYSHIAMASGNVKTDSDGNTLSVTATGSQTSTGPADINISMDKSGGNSYWSPKLTAAYRLPEINEEK